jgi:hypothetical protein
MSLNRAPRVIEGTENDKTQSEQLDSIIEQSKENANGLGEVTERLKSGSDQFKEMDQNIKKSGRPPTEKTSLKQLLRAFPSEHELCQLRIPMNAENDRRRKASSSNSFGGIKKVRLC